MADIHQDQGREIAALRNRLEQAGISTAEWGKGEAKTLENLAKELREGECALVEQNGRLLRTVTVVDADVFYEGPDGLLRLVEDKQVFVGGRERRRNKEGSVSEKTQPGKDPAEEMVRGLREELGITGEVKLDYQGENGKTIESPSYPGLTSRYVNHKFCTFLSPDQYRPDGYIEVQDDKTTYFIWQRVDVTSMPAPAAAPHYTPAAEPSVDIAAEVRVSTASAIVVSKNNPYLVLVANSAKHPKPVIPGGKVEQLDLLSDANTPGLSCVLREVREEINTDLVNPRYLGKATDPDRDIRLVPAKKVAEAAVEPPLPADISSDATVRAHYGCPDYIFVGEVDETAISTDTEELQNVRFIDIRELRPGDLSAGHDVIVLTYRDMLDAKATQFPPDSLRFFNLEREEFAKR